MERDADEKEGAGTQAAPPDSSENGAWRAPAEWEPHERCWIAWPNPTAEWPDWDLAEEAFRRLAYAILDFEPLGVVVRAEEEPQARRLLSSETEVVVMELDDAWMRDIGPTFVVDDRSGSKAGVDWRFNAWGGKWPHEHDAIVAARLLEHLGMARIPSTLVMEGGGVHFDGQGTLLAVRQSVLHENRNPEVVEDQATEELCRLLGGSRTIWLDRGMAADHTDGHVDEIAAFLRPGVLAVATAPIGHPDHATLERNRRLLAESEDAQGRRLEVVELPLPERRFGPHEELALSYVNFYLPNEALLVPSFGDAGADDRALGLLADQFPQRVAMRVPALGIAQNGGGLHCVTQQEPVRPAAGGPGAGRALESSR